MGSLEDAKKPGIEILLIKCEELTWPGLDGLEGLPTVKTIER